MYLMQKGFHPVNFVFAHGGSPRCARIGGRAYGVQAVGGRDDVYRVSVGNGRLWPEDHVAVPLTPPRDLSESCRGSTSRLRVGPGVTLTLTDSRDRVVLRSRPGEAFGVCGRRWVMQFEQTAGMRFFGMGEKSTPFEKSGRTHRFWNTDAFGDFYGKQIAEGDYDPDYISVPYVIVKQGNEYAGILVDSPSASAICTGRRGKPGAFWLGADRDSSTDSHHPSAAPRCTP